MAASVKSSSMNQRATFVIFIALYAFSILSANGQKAAATTIGVLPAFGSANTTGVRSTTCSSTLFRCPSTGRCIPTSWLCDGDNDCGGGEDEVSCAVKQCGQNEHKCEKSHKCIPERWLCDAEDDCGDGSDEHALRCANRTCGENRYKCPNSTLCIPNTWLCDTQKDCENGEDEANCTQSADCSKDEFKCKNGRCIFRRWMCDHDDDCGDGSDEANCQYTCGVAQIPCTSDHRCIPQRWQCDGERDCPDGSDESNCYGVSNRYENATCRPYEFRCTDSACIHQAWQCDGEPDCPDGSDEEHCTNKTCTVEQWPCGNEKPVQCIPRAYRCNGPVDCANGADEKDCAPAPAPPRKCDPIKEFDCGNGTCIAQSRICDGKYDCPKNQTTGLYADEAPVQECSKKGADNCQSKKCDKSATCVSVFGRGICVCPYGYQRDELKSNQTWLVCRDTDECSQRPKKCSQICYNTLGSYYCACRQGYMLSRDKVNCRALGEHPKLLVSHRSTILEVDLRTKRSKTLIDGLESAVAMDYHLSKNTIVWSDVADEKIYSIDMSKAIRNSSGAYPAKNFAKTLVEGLSTPDGLAVDWVHNLIYWTDTGSNTISVVDIDGQYRKTLIDKDLDEPRAIAVDPIEGLVFWTDWGQSAKIERASMDGTHRTTIIDRDISWPNGLAIDLIDKRIFWADAKLKAIKSADYNGSNVENVLISALDVRHPFSIAVFEENVYWTDWETEGIHAANKYTGVMDPSPLSKGLVGPMAIRVYQEASQPTAHNKCENQPCEQLCLPAWIDREKRGEKGIPYTCQCADGYLLSGKSCVQNGSSEADGTAKDSKIVQIVDDKRHARTAFVTVAFIVCIALVVSFVAYAVWRHANRNTRRPKRFTLENPVYRRTVVDGGNVGDHYDHLRLDSDRFHSGGLGNGVSSMRGGSGVYQPTTTMSGDEMTEPDTIGVGVVQNGKYSMKLPLTEHEEGPDYA